MVECQGREMRWCVFRARDIHNRLHNMEQEQGETAVGPLPETEYQPYRKAVYEPEGQQRVRRRVYRVKRRRSNTQKEGLGWRIFYLAWMFAALLCACMAVDDWFFKNGGSEGRLVDISRDAHTTVLISLLLFVIVGIYAGYWHLFLKPQQHRRRNKWEQERRRRSALLWHFVIGPVLFLILYVLTEL